MSNTQDHEVVVTDEAVQNQPDQDQQIETAETEAEETDQESPEAEGEEVETPEQRAARLEKENEEKQKAIGRKTAAYSSLQKKYEEQRQEFERLQSQLQQSKPLEEPKPENFETHAEFIEAVKKHTAETAKRTAIEEFQREQLNKQAQAIAAERTAKANQQEAEYIVQNPEYKLAKVEFDSFIKTAQVPPQVEQAIVDQAFEGNVPHLIDYFGRNNGENMDQLAEISQMSPTRAAVEIYKIQQSLKAPEKKEKPITPPVKKPKGGGAPKKTLDQEESVLTALGLKG